MTNRMLNSLPLALTIVTLGLGCQANIKPVPGASAVRVTTNAQDVAKCNPVGNVDAPAADPNAKQIVLNGAAQLGANALQLLDNPGKYGGVAYKCPQ